MTDSDSRREHYIASYKQLLQDSINSRPSGLRQKLAKALGKHKSFISQITNPHYSIPIPVDHLDTIFVICRFSQDESERFLEMYVRAHPEHKNRINISKQHVTGFRALTIHVPILDDAVLQKQLENKILAYADQEIANVRENHPKPAKKDTSSTEE